MVNGEKYKKGMMKILLKSVGAVVGMTVISIGMGIGANVWQKNLQNDRKEVLKKAVEECS